MKKKTFRRVALARETLRVLDRAYLHQAAGGMTKTTCDTYSDNCTASANCQTATCNNGSGCNCSG